LIGKFANSVSEIEENSEFDSNIVIDDGNNNLQEQSLSEILKKKFIVVLKQNPTKM
jgi:hypothetical protein